jgi:hypothetical protein
MPFLSQEKRLRLLFCVGAICVHLIILGLLAHLVVFRQTFTETNELDFQAVRLAPPLPETPPPARTLPIPLQAIKEPASASSSLSDSIISSPQAAFAITAQPIPSPSEILAKIPAPAVAPVSSTEDGTSVGEGGNSGSGTGDGDGGKADGGGNA